MLLTNHAYVLFCLSRYPDATLREVGEYVGVTERAVHRIVSDLVAAGALRRSRRGRRNHYELVEEYSVEREKMPTVRLADLLRTAQTSGCDFA